MKTSRISSAQKDGHAQSPKLSLLRSVNHSQYVVAMVAHVSRMFSYAHALLSRASFDDQDEKGILVFLPKQEIKNKSPSPLLG